MPRVLVRKRATGGGPPPVVPANTLAPAVTGTATVGQLLSTTDGTWTGTAPITFTYQWQRDGVDIGGATASTYTLVDADYTHAVRCVVTAHNVAGAASANSNATAAVIRTYAQQVLADSPAGYWKFTDGSGTTAADFSGNSLTATLVNTPALSNPGPMTGETCVTFVAASSQCATRADNNLLDFGDTFTMECWVKLRSTPSDGRFISKDSATAYGIQLFSGEAFLETAGQNCANSSTHLIADTTTWHYLVATKSGTTRKIYIDAVDVTTLGTNATGTNNASILAIGRTAAFAGAFVDSHMGHVAVYPTALSAARVSAHFAARS